MTPPKTKPAMISRSVRVAIRAAREAEHQRGERDQPPRRNDRAKRVGDRPVDVGQHLRGQEDEARERQQRPRPRVRPALPRDQPAGDERPADRAGDQRDEAYVFIAAVQQQCESHDHGGDADGPNRYGQPSGLPHASIVSPWRARQPRGGTSRKAEAPVRLGLDFRPLQAFGSPS